MRITKLLTIVLISALGFGQSLPTVIPPSPETATILKHSPINVSHYTGNPNISIPFYTISQSGVDVPISLSYNSDGIRVDNISSWVGLGWSLNAGGLVSRTINKLPDDSSLGYMNTPYTIADFFLKDPNSIGPDSQSYQLWEHLGNGEQRDYEPDIFTFSFLGYSGDFYYNQNENIFYQAPLSNLKIEPIKNSNKKIEGFIFTDEKGIKYYFGLSKDNLRTSRESLERVRTKTVSYNGISDGESPLYGSPGDYFYQSWMLLDIEVPNTNNLISFDYFIENNVETYILQNEEFLKTHITQEYNIIYLNKVFKQPKLLSISFSKGSIVFEKNNLERLDLNNSFSLKKIRLLDISNNPIKEMELHTSYITSPDNKSYFFDFRKEGKYRLNLDSLSIYDKNLTAEHTYKFKYNPRKLPNRFSRSIDYFGFYNGKNNNSLIQKHHSGPLALGIPNTYFGDADRSVDPIYTNASVLEKIEYPTGGYDDFMWENNYAGFFTGDGSTYVENLKKEQLHLTNDSELFPDPDPNIDYSTTLTISNNIRGYVDFNILMSGCNPPDLNQTTCDFSLKIIGISNPNFLLNILQSSFSYKLLPGTYKIIAKSTNGQLQNNQQSPDPTDPGDPNDPFVKFQLSARWSYDQNPEEFIYSGLRIKEIKTYTNQNEIAIDKSYDYNFFNTNKSSGIVLNIIDILNEEYITGSRPGVIINGKTQAPSINTKGSLVGYKNVTENFKNKTQGYIQHTYTLPTHYLDSQYGFEYYGSGSLGLSNSFPSNFQNPLQTDWLRGNIEKIEIFDKDNRSINVKFYEYEALEKKEIKYFGFQIIKYPPNIDSSGDIFDNMRVGFYPQLTERHRLKRIVEKNLYNNENIDNIKEYLYNSISLVSEEKTTNSKNQILETKYFYPQDTEMAGKPHVQDLINQHKIGTPLVTQSFRNNVKLSEQETQYRDWGNGLLAPEIIKTAKGAATAEDRIKYNALDNTTGNPLEVQQEGGQPITYIWGYNKTLPIAKIENATYAQVQQYEANLQTLSNGTDEASLITALNNLRVVLPNAMITTYTHKPLIGVSTMTDSKGNFVRYHYDPFNRLEFVTDKDDKVVSENKYHYKN
ncbi:hypothetical protein SY27_11165 [Flavobacterium sp. 316]|uniref:hypothetical protein n=1 Tax=Flavobacterium sp. 316 TaxID=1603293 RepID=UPI0005E46045|nr:hypothetical protein [Flavobacterium sp. 316]KIX20469.1 hypothetical protein SY27_11165 [Flavobacterium sp. 316]